MTPAAAARAALALALALAAGPTPGAAAAEVPTREQILDAWAARERALDSGRLDWSDARDEAYRVSLRFDGPRMDLRYEGAPDTGARLWIDGVLREVCGPDGSRSLRKAWREDYPQAQVNGRTTLEAAESMTLRPALLWIRPIGTRRADFESDACRVDPELVSSRDGRRCATLRLTRPGIEERWHVDVERRFIPVRVEVVDAGANAWVEFDHADDPELGGRPTGWRTHMVAQLGAGRVAAFEPGGLAAGPPFRLDFPPGTWVNDSTRNQVYIVRDDGAPRVVTDAELDGAAPYEDLLATEPGRALVDRPAARRRERLVLAAVAAVLLALAALILREVRRPKPDPAAGPERA